MNEVNEWKGWKFYWTSAWGKGCSGRYTFDCFPSHNLQKHNYKNDSTDHMHRGLSDWFSTCVCHSKTVTLQIVREIEISICLGKQCGVVVRTWASWLNGQWFKLSYSKVVRLHCSYNTYRMVDPNQLLYQLEISHQKICISCRG